MPPEYSTLLFAGVGVGTVVFMSEYLLSYVIHHILFWMKGGFGGD